MRIPRISAALIAAAALAAPLAVAAQDKKPEAAAAAMAPPVSTCLGCHTIPGYQASFPQVYRVPKIGGQGQQYLEAALREYREGTRSHPTMRGVAKNLTDEQITALAAYFAARGK